MASSGDSSGDSSGGGRRSDDVGSVGDEAAKLFDALSGWAREQGAGGLGDLAGHAAESLGQVNEHLATGSAECTYCPVCRTVQALRHTSPDVRSHLTTAATSLLHAAVGFLETTTPDPDGEAPPRTRSVEPIRLDDET